MSICVLTGVKLDVIFYVSALHLFFYERESWKALKIF